MKLTLDEWLNMQKRQARVCGDPDPNVPKVIFIGIAGGDGNVETHMKLVAVPEWKQFQEIWEKISGTSFLEYKGQLPHEPPQFFLICN